MSNSLLQILADEFEDLVAPVTGAVEDPVWLGYLLDRLGIAADNPDTAALVAALQAASSVESEISDLVANPSPSFAGIAQLLENIKTLFTAIRALSSSAAATSALSGLGQELIELLIALHLTRRHPLAFRLGVLLTVIESSEEAAPTPAIQGPDGALVRAPVNVARFHLSRLSSLINDPAALLKAEYLNGLATIADASAMADKLFVRIGRVLRELGISWRYGIQNNEHALLGDAAPFVDHALTIYVQEEFAGDDADAGVMLMLSSADHGDLGLVVSPFGAITLKTTWGLWAIELDLTADVEAFAYGRHGATLLASASTVEIDAKVSATLAAPGDGPAFIFGSPTGSRIEIGGALVSAETTLTEAHQSAALSAAVSTSALVIAAGDGDGFLKSVLPSDGLKAKFDLGIAWSSDHGLAFTGGAGLDATLPVGISVGGVLSIPTVHLGLTVNGSAITAEVSVSVGLSIGPVKGLIDRIGINTVLTFPDDGANLGVADAAIGFKLPSGVGLVIDAAGVTGGGYLSYDSASHEYAGVLQLAFADLALQAFGLLATRMGQSEGYSLIALVDAEFPPVQLGWGFTLDGVGGLLGVHRTASVDALRGALRADQLSSILFPTNAVSDASRVLGQLDTLFPAAPGRFLFGPMAKIGWGTPTVLTASIAIVLELPEPIKLLLLARVALRLPTQTSPLMRVNMDALGVLDLGKSTFSLDATLYDSRLLTYTLSGDMALRAAWSGQREFLLAIGGFHPRFAPPAGFPSLKRVTVQMSAGAGSTMRLQAYLAVTSNTLQFGAALDVFIGVSGYGLAGHLGFDALLQISPFHFEADISGSVALMAGSDDLMSVSLTASISGPAPWHVEGSFTVHIVFFDVGISFHETWGDDAPAQPIAAVDVAGLVRAALADLNSWGARLPAGTPALVSTRRTQDPNAIVAHPLALLEVQEHVVPLDLDITRFGAAPPSGAHRFAISDARIGGAAVPREILLDDFAPAQFFDLTDEEKLTRPSFERHESGLRFGDVPAAGGTPIPRQIGYETFYIDDPGTIRTNDPAAPVTLFWLLDLGAILESGSAGHAAITRAGRLRYVAPFHGVTVAEPVFVIADTNTLALAGIGASAGDSYSRTQAALDAELALHPDRRGQLQVVARHELGAA